MIRISWLVLVLQCIASSQCHGETIIIHTSCPAESQCTTLQQYASNPSQYSAVILALQPGNHTLNTQLSIANVENFTIIGNDSRVVCTSESGDSEIILTSVQNVFITEVSFIGCDRNMLSVNGDSVVISNVEFHQNRINIIDTVNTLLVTDSVFDRNTDTALDLTRVMNLATIEGCIFSNNGHRGITAVSSDLEINQSTFHKNRGPGGGCIHAQSSTVTISVTNFTECTSEGGRAGGAVYGTQVAFTISKTNFTDNVGYGGAAIGGGSSSFNITSSNFIRNIGGAIMADFGTSLLTLTDTNFVSNVGSRGGGIYTRRLDSLIDCTFMSNRANSGSGGGLWVETERTQSINVSKCSFVNNTASAHGGGMYIKARSGTDNISLSVIDSGFSDNIAGRGHGGGVYLSSDGQYARMMVIGSNFRNNTATSSQESLRSKISVLGGAIYMSGGNSSIAIDSSDFSMNSASGSGGSVYVDGSLIVNLSNFTENSALLGDGGAIQSNGYSANVTMINSMFDYNSAPSCGVLGVRERFHVVELKDCSFTYNTATGNEIGGGVSCISSATVSIINCNMSHNSANTSGGVLYINAGTVQIENSNLINNSAERYGGVAYTYIHATSYSIIESSFYQNSAGSDGGVLYVGRRNSSIVVRESEFSNNSASERGGVISIIGSDLIMNVTTFNHNTANRGKIISACNSMVSIYNSTGQVLMQTSRNVCIYFDSVNSHSFIEPISNFSQALCIDCNAFIILTSSDNYCPGEFTGDPCLTLQQYAGSPSFDANISLLLEPGNHTLTRELIASDSYNYTMSGSDSKVLCNNPAQVSFTSIQHVIITGVSFMGCAQNVLSANGESVELRNVILSQNRISVIEVVNNIIIIDSTFDRNSDTGLELRSIASVTKIENCIFSNNGHRGITAVFSDLEISTSTFHSNIGPQGGCLYAESSTVTVRDSNFSECTSREGLDGGAMYGEQAAFTIIKTNFTDNRAGFGGGAIAGGSSSYNITSSNFIRNVCGQWGGAIKADIGTRLLILADTYFISNRGGTGGAVYAYRLDTLVCCDFTNNAGIPGNGGGLYVWTAMPITISYCNFLNNTSSGGGFGGAGASIFVENNIHYVSVNIIGSSFVNNTALPGHGGGLLVKSNGRHASIIVTDSSFRNNSASLHDSRPHWSIINGGAIYFTGDNGSVFINNSDLMMNYASISGGAVYVTGSVFVNNSTFSQNRALMGEGGAVVSNQQNASISLTQAIFSQNTAPSCGALSIQNSNHVITLTDSSFLYNEGTNHTNGGGVACFNSSLISAIACTFLNNMANYHGGVFIIQLSSFSIEDSSFHDNFALQDGGVIYSSTNFQSLSTIYRSSFIHNIAGRDGGVLFIETTGELLNISQSVFSNNSANNSGGIIHVNEGSVYISETNIFNNTADLGNAIRACDSTATFQGLQFTISTDSSNCTQYNGNTGNFDFRNLSHTLIDIVLDTNLTTYSAICPFEYNTEIVDATTAPVTATSTPEVTTSTVVRPDTTSTETTVTTSLSTERVSGTLNQETTTGSTSEFLDTTTSALTTVAGTSMGVSESSGAVVGGIVAACLTVLLLVMASSIGGCFLYHILHKKNLYALKDNGYQESIGMLFKNENFDEDQKIADVIETSVNVTNGSEGNTEQTIVPEGPIEEAIIFKGTTEPTMVREGPVEQDIVPEQCIEDTVVLKGITEQTIVTEGPTLDIIEPEHMTCPVCKDVQVDPCTLQCGHTVCQLCLARMWKNQKQFCPLCKEHWKVYPAITIDYRDNIEKIYGEVVAQLRDSYTQEDKELIKDFQLTKRLSSPGCNSRDQEFSSQDLNRKELKHNADYEDQSTSACVTKSPLSQPLHKNSEENWYSQSVIEKEPIYASTRPHIKTMGSKPSFEVPNIWIKEQPKSNMNIEYHGAVTLSVCAAYTGAKQLCYKWKRNGQDITNPKCSGVNTCKLSIDHFSPEHEGKYTCIISDDEENFVQSNSAKLKLGLHITKHPQFPPRVKYGDYVAIFVSAVGDHNSLRYSWKFNGEDIKLASCTGSNTRILVIEFCSIEYQGDYTCIVSNSQGEVVESNPAHLKLAMEGFDSSMTTNDFHVWLQWKGLGEKDLQVLKCEDISTASVFQDLNSDDIEKLELSSGGRIRVRKWLREIETGYKETDTLKKEHLLSQEGTAQASATALLEKEHLASQKGLKVDIRDLHLLKWHNTNGDNMQTMIIDSVCHKWADIAALLSKKANKIQVLSQQHMNNPSQCVRQVFLDCFISNKPDRYSQDWNGIIELLKDIQEEVLSEEVRDWLEMQ